MHLGKRISLLIRANLGRLGRRDRDPAEAALRRADKTEALLEQLGERLNRTLARQAQLEGQIRQAEEMARQWDQRADEALRAGNEAAAREAVRNKLAYTQAATELRSSLTREAAATRGLQKDLAKLESRLARVREKRHVPPPPTLDSQPATEDISTSVTTPAAVGVSPAEEISDELKTLQERMSQIWSNDDIENELDAIKSRLSAGRSTPTR
jgi:phage shock protein A